MFLLIIKKLDRPTEIRRSVFISKSQRNLCATFFRTDARWCIYHLFIWANFNFLHNFPWITLSTPSCLVLYSFWANLQCSLIMWLIVSALSRHNLHLLFCFVSSFLSLIWLILLLLFARFLYQRLLMVFHWSLSDSKPLQVSKTLLMILNNTVVWMVSAQPPMPNSSTLFTKPWEMV